MIFSFIISKRVYFTTVWLYADLIRRRTDSSSFNMLLKKSFEWYELVFFCKITCITTLCLWQRIDVVIHFFQKYIFPEMQHCILIRYKREIKWLLSRCMSIVHLDTPFCNPLHLLIACAIHLFFCWKKLEKGVYLIHLYIIRFYLHWQK